MRGKKGYIQDFLIYGVILIAFIIITMLGGKLFTGFNDKFQEHPSINNDSKLSLQTQEDRYPALFNWIIITVFIFIALAIFVTMFVLDTHPAMYFVVVILFVFILVVLGILGNVFEKFSDNETMQATAAEFNLVSYLMDNWVFIMMVLGFFGIVLLFAKLRVGVFR